MAQKDVLVGFVVISGASPKCWQSVFIGMPNAGSPAVSILPSLPFPGRGCFSGAVSCEAWLLAVLC